MHALSGGHAAHSARSDACARDRESQRRLARAPEAAARVERRAARFTLRSRVLSRARAALTVAAAQHVHPPSPSAGGAIERPPSVEWSVEAAGQERSERVPNVHSSVRFELVTPAMAGAAHGTLLGEQVCAHGHMSARVYRSARWRRQAHWSEVSWWSNNAAGSQVAPAASTREDSY